MQNEIKNTSNRNIVLVVLVAAVLITLVAIFLVFSGNNGGDESANVRSEESANQPPDNELPRDLLSYSDEVIELEYPVSLTDIVDPNVQNIEYASSDFDYPDYKLLFYNEGGQEETIISEEFIDGVTIVTRLLNVEIYESFDYHSSVNGYLDSSTLTFERPQNEHIEYLEITTGFNLEDIDQSTSPEDQESLFNDAEKIAAVYELEFAEGNSYTNEEGVDSIVGNDVYRLVYATKGKTISVTGNVTSSYAKSLLGTDLQLNAAEASKENLKNELLNIAGGITIK